MALPITGITTMKGLIWARTGVHTRRESSYDRTGGNADCRPIEPGGTLTLADLQGPGCITHLWFTIGAQDQYYLRSLVLRIWWDHEAQPSVEVPVGDFFGLGHARLRAYQSYPFVVTNGTGDVGGGSAMNCYFQMPFARAARVTVENQGDQRVGAFYFYVDYESYDQPLPPDVLYFHAQWRRENPTTPIKGHLGAAGKNYWSFMGEPNLDGKENYVILEASGRGHYVGCNLSIDNFDPLPNGNTTWWGEGDDMIYVDGEAMPGMTGTGSEDYFCHAWGMQDRWGLYTGTSIWHWVPGSDWGGKFTVYRYHIEDPVVFTKSVKVTIEHGHANLQGNDYASTAYWYQTEPHAPFPELPARAARLPRPDFVPPPRAPTTQPRPGSGAKPFIREWLALGPFASPLSSTADLTAKKPAGIDTVYPPERKLRSLAGPTEKRATYTGKEGRQLAWRKLAPEHVHEDGYVNLHAAFPEDWAVAYLLTRVYSKKARPATLWLGSDDGCKAWVNGKAVFSFVGARAAAPHQNAAPIRLKKGWNVLLLKVEQFTGAWGAYVRLEETTPPPRHPEDLGASI